MSDLEIEPETLEEVRAILKRDCIVEVTVTFFDQSEQDALEPVDIGCSLDFDADTPLGEQGEEVGRMLDSLKDIFRS